MINNKLNFSSCNAWKMIKLPIIDETHANFSKLSAVINVHPKILHTWGSFNHIISGKQMRSETWFFETEEHSRTAFFLAFRDILLNFSQSTTQSRSSFNCFAATLTSLEEMYNIQSSANLLILECFKINGRSFMNNINNKFASLLPCGRPWVTSTGSETHPLNLTRCFLSFKKSLNHFIEFSLMPYLFNLFSNSSLQTVSKAQGIQQPLSCHHAERCASRGVQKELMIQLNGFF